MTPESLLAWRKARELSQETLALQLGCSRRAIVNWEAGKTSVPRYIALALAALRRKLTPEA